MTAALALKKKINLLMTAKGWTNNQQITKASNGTLTNGTLGRIRGEGENTKLNQLDELALAFGVPVHELLMPSTDLENRAQHIAGIYRKLPKAMQDQLFLMAEMLEQSAARQDKGKENAALVPMPSPVEVR